MSVLVRQIVLRYYKSIAQCKVGCGDLTVLIGPNGVGKSNFVDALRFVSESLTNTLEFAIRQRGGIGEVRRRPGGHPNHFAISLRLQLNPTANAHFAFQIGARPEGAFTVQHEQAGISCEALDAAFYEVREGSLVRASEHLRSAPKALEDRLFLTAVSGVEAFRPLFDALAGMGFYSINPDPIREIHPHDRGELLDRSGRNLAAVIKRLSEEKPHVVARIEEYLRQIVPGIEAVDHVSFGPRETLGFRQTVQKK